MAKRTTKLATAVPAVAGARHVQIARSSVAGKRPADNAQPAGSLYVNFADKVLGYIDANGVHQDYVPTGGGSAYTLPPASATALGGVFAKSAPGGQYMTGIDTAGNPTFATPTYTAPVVSVNSKTGAVVLNYADVGAAAASHTHSEYALVGHTHSNYADINHTHTGTANRVAWYNASGVLTSSIYVSITADTSNPNAPQTLFITQNGGTPTQNTNRGWKYSVDGSGGVRGKDIGCLFHMMNEQSINTEPTFTGFVAYYATASGNVTTTNDAIGCIKTNNKREYCMSASNANDVVLHNANAATGAGNSTLRAALTGLVSINGAAWIGSGVNSIATDGGFPLAIATNGTPNDWWCVGPGWANDGFFRVTYKGQGGNVYLTQGATSWAAASDERVKDVIEPITDGIEKTKLLRAIIGKYKTDPDGTRRAFLIAQDVQKALPEAVIDSNPDELGVCYTDLIPLLVATINEQTKRIEALEAMVSA